MLVSRRPTDPDVRAVMRGELDAPPFDPSDGVRDETQRWRRAALLEAWTQVSLWHRQHILEERPIRLRRWWSITTRGRRSHARRTGASATMQIVREARNVVMKVPLRLRSVLKSGAVTSEPPSE